MRVAEAAAAYKEASKEGDEAGEALFGETEDEAEDNAGSDESPLHWCRQGLLRLELALVFLEEEGMMRPSSVSISLSF